MSEMLKGEADEFGDITFTHTSDHSKFGIVVYIKKSGEKVHTERFDEEYDAVANLDLGEIAPAGATLFYNEESNDTNTTLEDNESIEDAEPETDDTEETEADNSAGITGGVVSDDGESSLGNILLYSVGAIAVLAIAFFGFAFAKKKKSGNGENIQVKKLSELKEDREDAIDEKKQMIEDAEKKIKEAQEEITKLKNDDRIKEVEKRILDDQKELDKLRSGKE